MASRIRPEDSGFSYELNFITLRADGYPLENVVSASMRRTDLRLALAVDSGRLVLAEFGSADALAETPLAAIGVAWSNGGDRLAVVTRADSGGAYVLHILTSDFTSLATMETALPPEGEDVPAWRLAVSWNSDDSLIAVSTDVARDPNALPRAVIVDSELVGVVAEPALANLYFIGQDVLVGIDEAPPAYDGSAGDVVIVELRGGAMAEVDRISGPAWVLGSDAPTGVFASIEPSFSFYVPTFPIGLRTRDAGADLVSGSLFTQPQNAMVLIAPR